MSELNLVLAVLGGVTLVLSLSVDYVRGRLLPLSEPLLATLAGVAAGPVGLGWIALDHWGRRARCSRRWRGSSWRSP